MRQAALISVALHLAILQAPAWALCEAVRQSPEKRFVPFGESYALLWHQMNTREWAGRDGQAMRARYSFKYTLCGEPYIARQSRKAGPAQGSGEPEFFLSYAGEFDFYLSSRPSDPVVNRLNNPALNVRMPLRKWYQQADADDQLILSLEHRSNGQATEASSDRGVEAAQRAYQARDQAYFDSVSRGSNFIGIALLSTNTRDFSENLDLGLKLKLHFTQDTDVRWGPFLGKRRTIRDYDILTSSFAWKTPIGWVDGSWTVGEAGIKASSANLGFQHDAWGIVPLYVRYHRGPMNTLSNYTQRQDSWGVGLRLARPFD